jgi:glycosyltransferase involved in cell wall biosynthesis
MLRGIDLDADVYHLHDPEMIPIGLKLKEMGKKVIFDAHEDASQQILTKPYLNPFLARLVSLSMAVYERFACRRFDGVVAATPHIFRKFTKINRNVVAINNYPLVGELDSAVPWSEKCPEIGYVGGISSLRGIKQVVEACSLVKTGVKLNLVGNFSEPAVEAEVKRLGGWQRVQELGFLDRHGVRDVLARCVAGLVTFLPAPNHVYAQPNKMFEYMSSGIPVIASDFPLWREILEGHNCGICVDPLDPAAIAEAIDYLVRNPEIAKKMGENGREAVWAKYNWAVEEEALLNFYKELLS